MNKVDYKQENAVELDQIKQSPNVPIVMEHGPNGAVIFSLKQFTPVGRESYTRNEARPLLYEEAGNRLAKKL